ncbi:hypothetical protein CMO95_00505 [Candidatus Woesearchaeota archaeon]|nr:hypothetical protein [Candidatus Woesearchaeota archaeon]
MSLISNNCSFFTTDELKVSSNYPEVVQGIRVTEKQLLNARLLVDSCLKFIRSRFGKVIITSWIRNRKLNKLIGGSMHTDHFHGGCVDFICETDIFDVFKWIATHKLPVRQAIYYWDKKFIHLSINLPIIGKEYKNEYLVFDKNGYRSF